MNIRDFLSQLNPQQMQRLQQRMSGGFGQGMQSGQAMTRPGQGPMVPIGSGGGMQGHPGFDPSYHQGHLRQRTPEEEEMYQRGIQRAQPPQMSPGFQMSPERYNEMMANRGSRQQQVDRKLTDYNEMMQKHGHRLDRGRRPPPQMSDGLQGPPPSFQTGGGFQMPRQQPQAAPGMFGGGGMQQGMGQPQQQRGRGLFQALMGFRR